MCKVCFGGYFNIVINLGVTKIFIMGSQKGPAKYTSAQFCTSFYAQAQKGLNFWKGAYFMNLFLKGS